ncbi:MAG: hypothetical protein Q8K88_04185, partial [Bradyrhizobium sp.]|nr:hypothetical protein [Bradyrhizobium sp.]
MPPSRVALRLGEEGSNQFAEIGRSRMIWYLWRAMQRTAQNRIRKAFADLVSDISRGSGGLLSHVGDNRILPAN